LAAAGVSLAAAFPYVGALVLGQQFADDITIRAHAAPQAVLCSLPADP